MRSCWAALSRERTMDNGNTALVREEFDHLVRELEDLPFGKAGVTFVMHEGVIVGIVRSLEMSAKSVGVSDDRGG